MVTITPTTLEEASIATNVIAEAFSADPTWTWAFPEHSERKKFWEMLIRNALRYPFVLRTANFEAVSVWIPPEGEELSPEDERNLPDFVHELAGARAGDVLGLLKLFESNHPGHERHYYLSLLGTQNNSRGHGFGMELLRAGLARIDAEQMPAYLESSNPVNNHKYEALGFRPVATFRAPGNGPIVTGMWRDSR